MTSSIATMDESDNPKRKLARTNNQRSTNIQFSIPNESSLEQTNIRNSTTITQESENNIQSKPKTDPAALSANIDAFFDNIKQEYPDDSKEMKYPYQSDKYDRLLCYLNSEDFYNSQKKINAVKKNCNNIVNSVRSHDGCKDKRCNHTKLKIKKMLKRKREN